MVKNLKKIEWSTIDLTKMYNFKTESFLLYLNESFTETHFSLT